MPRVPVLGFLYDEENLEKIGRHGLSDARVDQVLSNEHILIDNRKQRRARYLVIGRDNGGACITVPIEPTGDPVLWRPVTAWPCKPHERARLDRSK